MQAFPFHQLDDAELRGHHIRRIWVDHIPRQTSGLMKKQHRMFWQKERTSRTSLTYFPLTSLPLDAGLEVLGFLHPMDLFSVAQVSRLMRAIILNRKIARDVWRSAYRRHPDLPAPPSTISEPRWTFLCFGPDICSMCGDRGAMPFFAFSKKYCLDCSGDFTALPANIKDAAGEHPCIGHPVWDLLPYERTLTGFRYHIPDVESMLKKLTLMQILIDHKVQSLTAVFNTDKSLLLARASERKKCSLKALRWRATFIGLASSEQRTALRVASDKTFELLCGLGYRPWDINLSRLERLLEGSRVHNLKAIKRAFRYLLSNIESVAIHSRRRDYQTRRRFTARMFAFYEDQPRGAWETLPHSNIVVDRFLRIHFHEDMDYDEAERIFPTFLGEAAEAHRMVLVKGLPDELRATARDIKELPQKMDLAVAVYSCRSCRSLDGQYLVGWKAICRHMRILRASGCVDYRYNPEASRLASYIVSRVGLDSLQASVDDMDNRNDRFLCGECPPTRRHRISSLEAFTWFDMLIHLLNHDFTGNPTVPSIRLLSPEARDFVLDHENLHFRPTRAIWKCNKCPRYDVKWASYDRVSQHCRREHRIKLPTQGHDMTLVKQSPIRSRPHQVRLWVEPGYDCVCLRCPVPGRRTLFTTQQILRHLQTNHGILNPTNTTDWVIIQMVREKSSLQGPEF